MESSDITTLPPFPCTRIPLPTLVHLPGIATTKAARSRSRYGLEDEVRKASRTTLGKETREDKYAV
jgi:hypothetical protein